MKNVIVSRKVNKMIFALKENSPKIFLFSGLIAGGACVVVTVRQTLKASKKIDKMREDISAVKEMVGKEYYEEDAEIKPDVPAMQVYTEDDAKSDSIIVYRNFIIDMAKLYIPVAGLGAASVFMILKSFGIMGARYAATAAALTSVETAFSDYRNRVKERYGEETESDIFHGVRTVKIEGTRVDENGKEKKFKEQVDVVDPEYIINNIYTRLITPANPCYDSNIDYMTNTLNIQQNLANDILRAKGFITLNEVCRMLRLEENSPGMVVGWIFDDDNVEGDNKIEFSVKRVNVIDKDGVTTSPAYSIVFNVEGNIYKRLAEHY